MIIYGTKSVHLKTQQPPTLVCPSCASQGTTAISVFRKHAHIFWIPLFPIGKKGISQCQHCSMVLWAKEMPEQIKRACFNLKKESKGPLWQFSGLVLIGIFIVFSIYANGEDKKRELEYLKAPQIGDVYEFKIKTGGYSTLKVVNVTNDSVYVSPNEYEINKISKIYRIDKPENYSDIVYGISNKQIQLMYNTGEIFDINR